MAGGGATAAAIGGGGAGFLKALELELATEAAVPATAEVPRALEAGEPAVVLNARDALLFDAGIPQGIFFDYVTVANIFYASTRVKGR